MLPPVRGADTIVIGSGSAGAVIAARMTEHPDRDVLLLEAGPDYPDPITLPADLADGTRNAMTSHDWGYRHRPNAKQVLFPLPRGRVVGGSSAVNTCIGLRGVPSDYDEWAALGLPDWSWEKVLPAFKRLEDDRDIQNEWHGQGGPIPLRRHQPSELVRWQAAFLDACGRLGFPKTPDHNDPRAEGFGPHAMNKIGGVRMSAARGYLTREVRARENLRIRASTLVRRVLFEGRRAVGVEVETNGLVEQLHAKQVVVSAGAIATPGILLRSGVGPRRDVERLGVSLVSDVRAVGARLLDHPGSAVFFLPKRGVCDLAHPLIQTALRLRSDGSEHANDRQLQAGSCVHAPQFSVRLVSMMCQVGKPFGYGSIRWDSADPAAKPIIASGLLDDPRDRAHAVTSLLLAMELAEAPAMKDLIVSAVWPPPPVMKRRAWLDDFIRRVTDSGYHPCGTVPMGADGSPDAATDGRGRVRGTEGLVVADASLMPTVPTANTNLPTLMIGERFGAWLRDGEV